MDTSVDGWVTIGTKLDTKQLEKELNKSKRDLEKFQKDGEALAKKKVKLEIEIKDSDKDFEILNNKIEQAYQKLQKAKDKLNLIPSYKQDTEEYQQQLETVNRLQSAYDNLTLKHQKALEKVQRQEKELKDINNQIKENATEQENLNNKIEEMTQKLRKSKGIDAFKDMFSDANNSMTKLLKSIVKWGLALFSIRSAYMFIRQAVSTISQYNEQVAKDLEYIRYSLASILEGVVKSLVSFVYKLLQYVNYIANAWFGINLFSKATSDNFNKANNNAKKLQKTLAGFDEMNILSDNSTDTNTDVAPSVDLSKILPRDEVPTWVQWIADNGETILLVASTLGVLFGADMVNKVLTTTAAIIGNAGTGLTGVLAVLEAVAVTWLITLAIDGIKEINEKIKQTTENLQLVLELEDDIQNGNKITAETFWDLVASNEATNGTIQDYIRHQKDSITMTFKMLNAEEKEKYQLGTTDKQRKILIDTQKKQIETIKGNIDELDKLYKINKLSSEEQENYKNLLFDTIGVMNDLGLNADGLKQKYLNLTGQEYDINLKYNVDTQEAEQKSLGFFDRIKSGLLNAFKGTSIGTILSKSSLFKHADGGIINLPGTGVALGGGHIGGEAGVEGIVPLTKAQQMELLGEAIAKYITINLTNVTKLDSRQIAREQREINAREDFNYNR